jgi:hypothetical protein
VRTNVNPAAEKNRQAELNSLFQNTLHVSLLDKILCERKLGYPDSKFHGLNTLRKVVPFFFTRSLQPYNSHVSGSRMLSCKPCLWILVVACLLSSGRMLVNSRWTGEDAAENQPRSGQRFAGLREALPQRGVIGYIGQSQDSVGHYYLAQYALAPLVVDFSPNHPMVVGNFPTTPPQNLPTNLKLLRDFGNGVLLLTNEDAK